MSIRGLHSEWNALLNEEFTKPYFKPLAEFVNSAYRHKTIFPPKDQVFAALNYCLPKDIKVVIIGQDPYHQPNQANGLSFSVNDTVRVPPSLQNIFKELEKDIPGFSIPASGNLEPWARQGVLLLNAVLTVEASLPGSHKDAGWQYFTDAVIRKVNDTCTNLVFMLWGNYAIAKAGLIDPEKHLVLQAAHPSPLARGAFFGSRHFSQSNAYLIKHGKSPVNWQLS
ncbi:MAG TPA: uracil-DNA glycosylase [Bacteroidia bacterium]|nr:uracil-DNA glycosylase [Bacteroidia bacterium]